MKSSTGGTPCGETPLVVHDVSIHAPPSEASSSSLFSDRSREGERGVSSSYLSSDRSRDCERECHYEHCLKKVYGREDACTCCRGKRSLPSTPTSQMQRSPSGSSAPLQMELSFTLPEIEDSPEMNVSSKDANLISIRCDACAGCADTCDDPECPRCKNKSIQPDSKFGLLDRIKDLGGSNVSPAYSICQVKRRCKNGQSLIMAHAKVYDATTFLKCHPAGPRAILKKVGQDCTIDYDFHSTKARKEIWGPLQVGRLVPCAVHGPAQEQHLCLVM